MKRLFDLVVVIVCIPIIIFSLVLIALLVKVEMGSPVFFVQKRPGLYGKLFKMVKFRSMTSEIDSMGSLLPDEQRIRTFGKLLRSTSLDELPGLWSVFKGDMSLVGPRPLLIEYLPLYSKEQMRRHEVKPGITGWAQVNGRNTISWEQKFKLDVWYIDNHSFWLDLKILLRTIKKVLVRDGVSEEGEVTMTKFTGK